jgi:hypothetical protein
VDEAHKGQLPPLVSFTSDGGGGLGVRQTLSSGTDGLSRYDSAEEQASTPPIHDQQRQVRAPGWCVGEGREFVHVGGGLGGKGGKGGGSAAASV